MTSLSTQLQKLKIPSTSIDVTINKGPFLVELPKDKYFDKKTLYVMASNGIKELKSINNLFEKYEALFIGDSRITTLDESMTVVADEFIQILSPYLLLSSTQWVLQWLVTEYHIQHTNPVTFFFMILPFHEFNIYTRCIEMLHSQYSSKFTSWFSNFKKNCYPTTKANLIRHCTHDIGFFKLFCDVMKKIQIREELTGIKFTRFVTFYMTLVLQSLESCQKIGELQLHSILQPLVYGLKCSSSELEASSCMILSYILTKVSLKEKVLNKLLKIFKKRYNDSPSDQSLALLILLKKSQSWSDENILKISNLLELHKDVIFQQFEESKDEFYSFSVFEIVSKMCFPNSSAGVVNINLLKVMEHGLMKLVLESSAIEFIIENLHMIIKTLQDSTKSHDVETENILRKCVDVIKKKYSNEFDHYSARHSNDGNIFFFGGNMERSMPTENEKRAKLALLNVPMISLLCKHQLKLFKLSGQGSIKKLKKKNKDSLLTVMSMDTNFLLDNLSTLEIKRLLYNSLFIWSNDNKLIELVFSHLKVGDLFNKIENKNEKTENFANSAYKEFEILIISLMLSSNQDKRKTLVDMVITSPALKSMEIFTDNIKGDDCTSDDALLKCLMVTYGNGKQNINYCLMKQKAVPNNFLTLTLLLVHMEFKKIMLGIDVKLIISSIKLIRNVLVNKNYLMASDDTDNDDLNINDAESLIKYLKLKFVPLEVVLKFLTDLKLIKNCSYAEKLSININLFYLLCDCMTIGEKLVFDHVINVIKALCNDDITDYDKFLLSMLTMDASTNNVSEMNILPQHKWLALKLIQTEFKECTKKNLFLRINANFIKKMLSTITLQSHALKTMAFDIISYLLEKLQSMSNADKKLMLLENVLSKKNEIMLNAEIIETNNLFSTEFSVELRKFFIENLNKEMSSFEFISLCKYFPIAEKDLITKLSHFGLDILKSEKVDTAILEVIFSKYGNCLMKNFKEVACTDIFQNILNSKLTVKHGKDAIPLLTILLNSFKCSEDLDDEALFNIFSSLVDVGSESTSKLVFSAINETISIISSQFNAEILHRKLMLTFTKEYLNEDGKLLNLKETEEHKLALKSVWKKGYFILELLLQNKKIDNAFLLISPLFLLLKKSLEIDEFFQNEYSLEIILSAILHVVDNVNENELKNIKDDSYNPELIVLCIRNVKSPQTKMTALLILAKTCVCNPEFVLHNIIPIFTFMGNHLLKLDSRQSFDVACRAIDIIIPKIRDFCMEGKCDGMNISEMNMIILCTFVDASHDMPSHRYRIFLHKLVTVLDTKDYLWLLTLLLLKSFTKKKESNELRNDDKKQERYQQVLDLYSTFSFIQQLESVLQMMVNMNFKVKETMVKLNIKESKKADEKIIDEYSSIRLKMVAFICSLLQSDAFLQQITPSILKNEIDLLEVIFKVLIQSAVKFDGESTQNKINKINAQHFQILFGKFLAILPVNTYITLIVDIITIKNSTLSRKAIDSLNYKLHTDSSLMADKSIINVLNPLVDVITCEKLQEGKDFEYNRQLALISIRYLAKHLAQDYLNQFVSICAKISKTKFLESLSNGNVLAATLLCVEELSHSIGPQSVIYLPKFMSYVLKLMGNESFMKENKIIMDATIFTIQRLVENFSGFLSPFYEKLVISSCLMNDWLGDERTSSQTTRETNLLNSLATSIPSHILLHIFEECFLTLSSNSSELPMTALLSILKKNLETVEKSQLISICSSYVDLFIVMLDFRQKSEASPEVIDRIESRIIDAFVSLSLRLSLQEFKPYFNRVFNYSTERDQNLNHSITIFHLTLQFSEKLKSLFGFISESLVDKVTKKLNIFISSEYLTKDMIENTCLLLLKVLNTLSSLCTHNKLENISAKNFEDLINSVLCCFEIPKDDDVLWNNVMHHLIDALGQICDSTDDDSLWKYLNYQVLLKLRNDSVQVRVLVLKIIDKFLDKKGENYLAVLPDAVPFLSEILEDTEQDVEMDCRKLISKMEKVFDQKIESYFV